MNIKIGENIKRLRINKNITQEKLANHLQITYQTISKWERDEGYPDITMLIPLANYFEVTVDELLGTDAAKNEIKIQEYLDEYDKLNNIGYADEGYELIIKAYQEFPHDWRIINKYIEKLKYGKEAREKGFLTNEEEIRRLCEDILERCNIDSIRYEALYSLAMVYSEKGDEEKAVETLDKLPDVFYTHTTLKGFIFNSIEKNLKYHREAVDKFAEQLSVLMRDVIMWDKNLTVSEQIKGFEDLISVIKLIYGEDKYCGFMYYHLDELYIWLGNRYIQNKEYDKGIECLYTAMDYAIKNDEIPYEETKLEGIFVKDVIFDMRKVYSGSKGNEVKRELDWIKEKCCEENSVYADVKNHPKFIELFEKYEPYAKEYK